MAATIHELLRKGLAIHANSPSLAFKSKIETIAHHFDSVETFLNAAQSDIESIEFVSSKKVFTLTESEFEKIASFQKSGLLNPKLSIEQNFMRILTTEFISRQLRMIENLSLDTLNINPILASVLNLNNERDLIRYYVYQAISRSIVTSLGFLVQNLLLYSSEYVYDGKEDELGDVTKWDIIVEKLQEVKSYIEIKSGTNDANKAQVKHYWNEIQKIESKGFRAYFGETYGRREDRTVTHGLLKQYLPEWEKRTLIGKELWAFVSGKEDYHILLMQTLLETSEQILSHQTIIDKIENRVEPIVLEFKSRFGSMENFKIYLW